MFTFRHYDSTGSKTMQIVQLIKFSDEKSLLTRHISMFDRNRKCHRRGSLYIYFAPFSIEYELQKEHNRIF